MNKNLLIGAIVLIILLGGGALLMKNNAGTPQAPQVGIQENLGEINDDEVGEVDDVDENEAMEAEDKDDADVEDGALTKEGVKTFEIEASSFKFSEPEIRVKQGDTVRIVLENEGGIHDWVVDEFNARTKQLKSGETETIEFVASKKGTFEYYCSVGQHRQNGMVGNLIVE